MLTINVYIRLPLCTVYTTPTDFWKQSVNPDARESCGKTGRTHIMVLFARGIIIAYAYYTDKTWRKFVGDNVPGNRRNSPDAGWIAAIITRGWKKKIKDFFFFIQI